MLLRLSLILPNLLENFLIFGKVATLPEVSVDDLTIDSHLKDATTPLFQIHWDVELLLNRRRQTGGQRKVISFAAVGNLNVCRLPYIALIAHNEPPFSFIFNSDPNKHGLVNNTGTEQATSTLQGQCSGVKQKTTNKLFFSPLSHFVVVWLILLEKY